MDRRRAVRGFFWLLALSACGPANASRPETPAPRATASAAAAPQPPGPEVAGYRRVFKVKLANAAHPGLWNASLALVPSGDVLVASTVMHDSSKMASAKPTTVISLLSRRDGSVVRETEVLASALQGDSLSMLTGDRAALVCKDAVREIHVPDLRDRELLELPPPPSDNGDDEPRACARGPHSIAIANDAGKVDIYAIDGWKRLETLQGPGPKHGMAVDGLALWGDDAIAASWRDGGLFVRGGPQPGVFSELDGFQGGSSGGLAFSPDGSRLFHVYQSFHADESWHQASRGEVEISSWLTLSRYLDPDHLASTGAHGLGIITLEPSDLKVLDEDTGEGLAVSSDASFVCGGARDGSVACFERAR
jgi:hypothetical protein